MTRSNALSEDGRLVEPQECLDRLPFSSPKPRWFLLRTLCLLVIPPGLTAYYIYIWIAFLSHPVDDTVKYAQLDGSLIFYSWFVLGVFGLSLGKYGLVGIEAAMLETKFWGVPDPTSLLAHAEASWNGPSGWPKILQLKRKNGEFHRIVHRLYYLLAFLSFCVFVALPLSGLVMEISDGYVANDSHPMVLGHRMIDLDSTWDRSSHWVPAKERWASNRKPTLPYMGILHTPKDFPRENYESLQTTPNSFPLDVEDKLDFFLAPQAKDVPIAGSVWGLRVSYQCKTVMDAADLTIITQKSSSEYDNSSRTLKTPSNESISSFSSPTNTDLSNVWQYAEMGTSVDYMGTTYNLTQADNFDLDTSPDVDILEYALWQMSYNPPNDFKSVMGLALGYNETISGLGSPLAKKTWANGTSSVIPDPKFFEVQDGTMPTVSITDYENLVLVTDPISAPIGVRCRSVAAYGNAMLDPRKSTFASFEPYAVELIPFGSYVSRPAWISNLVLRDSLVELFPSADEPSARPTANNLLFHINFIKPDGLHRSVMLSYAWSAYMLMYDLSLHFNETWRAENATSSSLGKVITKGIVPTQLPLVLFLIWATGCLGLALRYGFCKRRDNYLDGARFVRLGYENGVAL